MAPSGCSKLAHAAWAWRSGAWPPAKPMGGGGECGGLPGVGGLDGGSRIGASGGSGGGDEGVGGEAGGGSGLGEGFVGGGEPGGALGGRSTGGGGERGGGGDGGGGDGDGGCIGGGGGGVRSCRLHMSDRMHVAPQVPPKASMRLPVHAAPCALRPEGSAEPDGSSSVHSRRPRS